MVGKHSGDGYRQTGEGVVMKNLVHGANTMMMRFRLTAGILKPPHSHPQEQTGYLLSGALRLTIAGVVQDVGPGDSWCILGDVEHTMEALEDSEALEIFAPLREAYLA